MLTLIVYAVVALIVVGALVVLAVLVLPGTEQLAPAPPDQTPWSLPADRAMVEHDVSTLKLPVTLRGYRFAETDAVLDRLGAEINQRDQVIADLLARLEPSPPPGAPLEAGVDEPLTELGETPEDTDGPATGERWAEPAAPLSAVDGPSPVVVAIDEDFGLDDEDLDYEAPEPPQQ